jgi:acyl carrier protein
MAIQDDLRSYILREHLRGEDPSLLDDADDLIESGVLDSFAIMKLITHLEKTYGVEIDIGEVVPENFGSVANLADYVVQKLAKT